MEFNTIEYDYPEDGIGRITLNRPERLNAINLEILTSVYPVVNWEPPIFCLNLSAMHGQLIYYSPEERWIRPRLKKSGSLAAL